MLKTAIKHYIIDMAINSLFNGIITNFTRVNSTKLIVGHKYKRIIVVVRNNHEYELYALMDVCITDIQHFDDIIGTRIECSISDCYQCTVAKLGDEKNSLWVQSGFHKFAFFHDQIYKIYEE